MSLPHYLHENTARRERADQLEAKAERARIAAAESSPLARLARGETVDLLALTDAELDALFPAAVFAAVWIDMVRAVETHQKRGGAMEKTA